MASEFEEHRKKRLMDDLNDALITDCTDDDIVCGECGSILFMLNYEKGVMCADCKSDIDLQSLCEL